MTGADEATKNGTTQPAGHGPVLTDRLGVRFPEGDRPSHYPGGMECFECGCIFIGAVDHRRCKVCEEAAGAGPACWYCGAAKDETCQKPFADTHCRRGQKTSKRKVAKAHIAALRQREDHLRASIASGSLTPETHKRQEREACALAWAVDLLMEHARKQSA